MGKTFADEYALLHFATGVIFCFWNISFKTSLIIHTLFELVENTIYGVKVLGDVKMWPGGKTYSDYKINMVGDSLFFTLGWYIASLLYTPTTEVLRLF